MPDLRVDIPTWDFDEAHRVIEDARQKFDFVMFMPASARHLKEIGLWDPTIMCICDARGIVEPVRRA